MNKVRNLPSSWFYNSATFFVFAIAMYPVVKTPLIADDFGIALGQVYRVEQSWAEQFDLAWRAIFEGTHFNLVGNYLAMLWIKAWISFSIFFDLNLHIGFWALKIFVMSANVLAIAWFTLKHFGINFRYSLIASTLLFSTLIQIHAPWSNDPVTNFTLAGFFVVPFALLAISSFIQLAKNPTLRNLILNIFLSFLALLIYEINFAIICFYATFLITMLIFNPFGLAVHNVTYAAKLFTPLVTTTLAVLILRTFASNDASNYGGTSIAISEKTFSTLVYNFASSLPFVSHQKSSDYLGSQQFTLLNYFLVGIFVVLLGLLFSRMLMDRKGISLQLQRSDKAVSTSISISLLIWVIGAIGIQSLTPKVQTETHFLGGVYTFYAVAYVGIILIILANLRLIFNREQLLFFATLVLLSLSAMQLNINLGLKVWLNQSLTPNLNLVALATGESTSEERCTALNAWLAGPWPEYYEAETVVGLDLYSLLENNEKFCLDIK